MKKIVLTIIAVFCTVSLCGCQKEPALTPLPTQQEETVTVPASTAPEVIPETAPEETLQEEPKTPEFFYGTWKVDTVTMHDVTLPLEDWVKLGTDASVLDYAFVFQDTGKCYTPDGNTSYWKLTGEGIDFGDMIAPIVDDKIILNTDGMIFSLKKVSEDQTLPGTEELPTEETQAETAASGLRPEFLKAMDTYEAFYDEYCALMKQYKANPTDLSLLTKYMNMLSKLEDIDSAFKAWDSNDLNAEELKYYLDVTARIQKKMIDLL